MPNVKIGVGLGTPDAASAQMETGQAWSFRTGGGGGVLYSGSGAPSLSVGGIGDFYVDETDFPTSIDLYGPKAEGDWGSPITLGAGGVGAAAFTDLTDVPVSYTGQGSKIVSVKVTEDGLEFIAAPAGSFTPGDLTDAGTDGIVITGGTGAVNGSGTSIAQTKADATHNGYLDKDDWSTFNSKENALGYTPEDVANKSSDEALGNSNTLYPTQNATKVYVDAAISSAVNAGSRVLSGGGVAWTGTNFDYIISAADYLINGVEYNSAETPVTLAAADVTYDRIDVFYVDDAGLAGVITGTPADNPVAPAVDPATQLYLTFAYVVANSTEPDVTVENIYLENTEWTMTASGGTINVASTNNPYAGTKDIEATNAASGHLFTGVKPSGTLAPGDYAALVFEIRSKAAWPNPKAISIFFLNGAASVGSAATLKQGAFGFDSSNTTTYQQIVIPIAVFNTGAGIIDRLRFQVTGGGGNIGWYIDNITLQGGGGGGTAGGDFSTNTNVSVINEIVLFADTTGKLGKRSTGTGIAKLTGGVLGTASEGSDYLGPARIDDTAYDATTWNGDTSHAPSKNAVRDKFESLPSDVSGAHYVTTQAESGLSAEFNLGGLTTGLLKHSVAAGVSTPATASEGTDYLAGSRIDDTAYNATTWDGDTDHAPSKNAVRDKIESLSSYVDARNKSIVGATWYNAGDPVTAGKAAGFIAFPVAGTITAWAISVDTGTATIKVWKVATGTAVPDSSNSINTSGVSISSGTHVRSTTLTDFGANTAVTANDIFAFNLESVTGSPTEVSFQLEIQK